MSAQSGGNFPSVFATPKLDPKTHAAAWYRYYAGFSPTFVENVLDHWGLENDAVVLDPWNGAGTTTRVVAQSGRRAAGTDINPACVIAARAALLDESVRGSLVPLAKDLLEHSLGDRGQAHPHDPICEWLGPTGATFVRAVASATEVALIDGADGGLSADEVIERSSSLAAFYFLALFRTVRNLLASFR